MKSSILKATENTFRFGGLSGEPITDIGSLGDQSITFNWGGVIDSMIVAGKKYGTSTGGEYTKTIKLPPTGIFYIYQLQTTIYNNYSVMKYIKLKVDTDPTGIIEIGNSNMNGNYQITNFEANLVVKLIGINPGTFIDSLQFEVVSFF